MENKVAKDDLLRFIDDSGIYGNPELTDEMYKALWVAIKALERQMPKKPAENGWLFCPICGRDILMDRFNYCPNCGQAIDWELEE